MTALNKCPHCKSDKGFVVNFSLGGSHTYTMDFKGDIIDSELNRHDTMDMYAVCINCRRVIPTNKLRITV